MKHLLSLTLTAAALFVSVQAHATGLATCDSGPREGWQSQEKLQKMLSDKGMKVRRIKVDGGCYEAYVLDSKGKRAELYFDPRTLAPIPVKSH